MGLFGRHEAEEVTILGQQMRCEICHHMRFFQREGKIQTTAMTFFELDWANASATCLVCEQCGYVHWFLPT
ncbi:MAG: DNA-binding protein [Actinomycetota bacterium]|nr:DNA-binding protein [Actinomycetota bacterium]